VLEQFRHAEEQRRRLSRGERLPDIDEVDDTRQERPTFPRGDRRLVECPSFLDDCRLVVVERWVHDKLVR